MSKVGTPKVTGSSLTAGEHNSFLIQEERIITNAGGTLQIDDFVQKGQAITSYVGIATFLEDISVTANTIVLAPQTTANFDLPINNPATWNGFLLRFRPVIENTDASTVDFGYGAINIVNESGNALTGGELVTTRDAFLRYDLATTSFILLNSTLQSQVEANTTNIVTNALNITALQELQDKPITFSYSSATVINYTAGGFIFDDKTGSAIVTAGSVNFATNGLNGLDTGSLSANTWYYLFGIYNPTTKVSGVLASISKTTPTLPSGFTKKKYIGSCRTNPSSQIIPSTWTYIGNALHTYYDVPIAYTSTNNTITPKTLTLDVPLIKVQPVISWSWVSGTTNDRFNTMNFIGNISGTHTTYGILERNGTVPYSLEFGNTASQTILNNAEIQYFSGNDANGTNRMYLKGFIDLEV